MRDDVTVHHSPYTCVCVCIWFYHIPITFITGEVEQLDMISSCLISVWQWVQSEGLALTSSQGHWAVRTFCDQDDSLVEAMVCLLDVFTTAKYEIFLLKVVKSLIHFTCHMVDHSEQSTELWVVQSIGTFADLHMFHKTFYLLVTENFKHRSLRITLIMIIIQIINCFPSVPLQYDKQL